jgi:amino acid permease
MPIYAELIEPNYRRTTKVINRSILIDLTFYLTIAVAGYLSCFDKTNKIVVERDSLNGKPDIPCLISIMGVMLSILVAFPCSYNPTRF